MKPRVKRLFKPPQCEFTLLIQARGWTVKAACEHWGVEYNDWRRTCRNINDKRREQLVCRCNGLESKL